MEYDLKQAHKFSSNHKSELLASSICGCFYCLSIYSPLLIKEWIEDNAYDSKGTAICPYCGIDSVIGDYSGYPITKDFLAFMYKKYFG